MVIKNIAEGWFNRIFKPISPEEERRLEICNECQSKFKLGREWVCSECYCPIKSKVRSKDEKCLLNKW